MTAFLQFEQPWLLAAALLAAVPVAMALRARARGRSVSRRSVALQAMAIALLAAAMAGPLLPLGQKASQPFLVLEDRSASTRGQQQPLPLPADLPQESFVFGENVLPAGQAATPGNDLQTRLGPALLLAASRGGEISGLLLRTDGNFQDEHWQAAARSLAAARIPLTIVPQDAPPPDAAVTRLQAVRSGDGRRVEVAIDIASNTRQRRTMVLLRTLAGGKREQLHRRPLEMLAGESASLRLADELPPATTCVYEAALDRSDAFPENDRLRQVLTPVQRSVAVVAADDQWADLLAANAPATAAVHVAPGNAPVRVEGWQDYSAVVLVDDRGTLLSAARRAALAQYVRGGGGLLMLGAGPSASPADRRDALNQVLPLLANPYERRALKVFVLLDSSGSMGEFLPAPDGAPRRVKFDVAAQAVLSLADELTPSDALSVTCFSNNARRIYDSGSGQADFDVLQQALAKVGANGQTFVKPALDAVLAKPDLQGRDGLVVLLTDLRTADSLDVDALAARFKTAKLKLAIVATTPRSEEAAAKPYPLELLARKLDAPVVRNDTFAGLSEVFAGFLRQARPDALKKQAVAIRPLTTPLFGLPRLALGPADAYLVCAPQPKATVLATTADGDDKGDAVLARWNAGAGRCAQLALPFADGHNATLRASPQFAQFVQAAAAWVLRPAGDPAFAAEFSRTPAGLKFTMRALREGRTLNALDMTLHAVDPAPGGKATAVPLQQTAPGEYRATLAAGPAPLALTVRNGDGRDVWQGFASSSPGEEFARIGPNAANLRTLAELGGGKIVAPDEMAHLSARWNTQRRTPAWPLLAALALAAMLIDWATGPGRRTRA